MENSNKSIAMAEKRVGEMNKLTQGFLEQSNRYFQQRDQPQELPRQNTQFRTSPQNAHNQDNQRQNMQASAQNFFPNSGEQRRGVSSPNNVSPRNNAPNAGISNPAQKPRFEAVGNSRQRKPQPSAPPPRSEPPKPPQMPPVQNQHEPLLPISLSSDTALIAALATVLVKEKADTKLILALLYILM